MLEFPATDHRTADPAITASKATASDEREASIQFENQVDLAKQETPPPSEPSPDAELETPQVDSEIDIDVDPDALPELDTALAVETPVKEVLPVAAGTPAIAPLTPNPVTPGPITGQATTPQPPQLQSPLTDGPEGPVVPAMNTKEPDMQLSRLNRLRSFSPAVISAAAKAGGHPTSVDVDAEEFVQTQRPRQVSAIGQGAAQGTPQWPLTAAKQAQTAQQNPSASSLTAPAPEPARLTISERRGLLRTDSTIPSAIAGYAALPATKAPAPSAGQPTPSAEDLRLDPLALGTQDGPLRQTDTAAPTILRQSPRLTEAVAHQIAQIAQSQALHRREVVLQPEELGRVRLSLQTSDTAVNVSILVERPETLDLMRRHIGQLADEFRAMGYQDVSFEFAQQGQTQDGSQSSFTSKNEPTDPLPEEYPLLQSPANVAVQSRIDRRI